MQTPAKRDLTPMPFMDVRSPQTAEEFAGYYDLRWRVLREPWGQPPGSECDELESTSHHAMISGDDGQPIAVGRLHFNSPAEAQIRFMAVAPANRGTGLGRRVVEHLESIARAQGARRVVLNARDEAADFYAALGYEAAGAAPTMFGTVAHVRMQKWL